LVSSLRVAALTTGGKDSALALSRVLERGCEVEYLVTMIPQREDSWMFHYPNIHMTDFFAEAVGISLVKAKTSGVKDTELLDLKLLLSQLDIDAVVSGGVTSQYQKKSIDKVCKELGLKHIAPLWQEDPFELLEELIESRIEAIIIGVYAYGLDETWLGRGIDQTAINDLVELNKKYQVSMVGEGGEYETLVLDAPFFKKKIQLIETEKVWEGQSGYMLVKKAILANK
jgi:diphthine-ammonia ligase